MTNQELVDISTKICNQSKKNFNGFFLLSLLGIELNNAGVDFKLNGFEKLQDFITAYPLIFELSREESETKLPYVRLKEGSTIASPPLVREHLFFDDWGVIFDCQTKLKKLAEEIALKEDWDYGCFNSGKFPILKNYILYTFKKLSKEGKISETTEYAIFDTGLVNTKYDPIYAIFDKNRNKKVEGKNYHEWIFSAFAPQSDRYWGRVLDDNFAVLPARATYFSNADEMFFDTEQKTISLSDDHIFVDHLDRFPVDFLTEHLGSHFDINYIYDLPYYDKRSEFEKIKLFLKQNENERIVINMRNRIKDAINVAVKRVQWNFKTAIPIYFTQLNKMSLLLPLSLNNEHGVDLALVISKMNSGIYRGMTIYTLEMAYKNARLVTRPDSDWLVPNIISDIEDEPSVD